MVVLAVLSLAGAVALFADVMIWRQMALASLTAYGPICGGQGGVLSFLGHCPACYVAAALVGVGVAAGMRAWAQR